jgi:hypothetical protein
MMNDRSDSNEMKERDETERKERLQQDEAERQATREREAAERQANREREERLAAEIQAGREREEATRQQTQDVLQRFRDKAQRAHLDAKLANEKFKKAEKELKQHQSESEKLKRKIQDKDDAIAKLQLKMGENHNDGQKNKLDQLESEIMSLNGELVQMNKKMTNFEETIEPIGRDVANLIDGPGITPSLRKGFQSIFRTNRAPKTTPRNRAWMQSPTTKMNSVAAGTIQSPSFTNQSSTEERLSATKKILDNDFEIDDEMKPRAKTEPALAVRLLSNETMLTLTTFKNKDTKRRIGSSTSG